LRNTRKKNTKKLQIKKKKVIVATGTSGKMHAWLTLVVLATVAAALVNAASATDVTVFQNAHVDDVTFRQDLLFESEAASELACARACAGQAGMRDLHLY
jgi:hypothetical protein